MADGPADSPLSTTGNVIGILTFALAVVSFLAAFYAITHNAPDEIEDYKMSLRDREVHIQKIRDYFDEADRYADGQLEGNPIKDVIDSILADLEARRQKMEEVIGSVNGRLQWWYRRQDMVVAMARVENQLQYLSTLQLTFLLLKMKRQTGQLDDIEGDIRDLKLALATVLPRA
ncbi:uncharacterized protein E0L32_003765 [Thyridium curvatum]|uniref:Uncharacterized protein n=1 Tax=Thyridium curvatum TaxID=1093900 RepID=A0A507BHJ9_9PEZI|nr:uncharacterized protein E0L32_003765 [Thyridium curvatum]TPX16471.1 hypothetical protein E0L32_003765 [Thyridium curvatum]